MWKCIAKTIDYLFQELFIKILYEGCFIRITEINLDRYIFHVLWKWFSNEQSLKIYKCARLMHVKRS